MYGLLELLLTPGEGFVATALLEMYLVRRVVMFSILILPAVYECVCVCARVY